MMNEWYHCGVNMVTKGLGSYISPYLNLIYSSMLILLYLFNNFTSAIFELRFDSCFPMQERGPPLNGKNA